MDRQLIFISSSSDLRDTREELRRYLANWLSERGVSDLVAPYLWEKETEGGDLFDHRTPFQMQIPYTGDEHVILTIAMFGERCGVPLSDDAPPHLIEPLRPWIESGQKYRLLHPWKSDDRDDMLAALEQGCFPLTGTVFETLTAKASERDGSRLIAGHVADTDIVPDIDLDEIVLNNEKVLNAFRAPIDGKPRNRAEVRRFETEEYNPQVLALLNFLKRFVLDGSFPIRCATEEVMLERLKKLATEHLEKRLGFTDRRWNPYRGLAYFDIGTPGQLPGRAAEARACAGQIVERFRSGRSPCVLVTGPSGCGKSSFVRGGILKELGGQWADVDLRVLAVRPTDLWVAGSEKLPLRTLLDRIEDIDSGLRLPNRLIDRIGRAGSEEGHLMRQLSEALAERLAQADEGAPAALAIGIDQFEEIVDELARHPGQPDGMTSDEADVWWPLIHFLEAAAETGRVGVVATLESLREDRFEGLRLSDLWRPAGGVIRKRLSANDLDFAERVIREPFATADLRLDEEVVANLVDAFRSFVDGAGPKAPSALPLLSLRLEHLFDQFSHRVGSRKRVDELVAAQAFQTTESEVKVTMNDIGKSTELDLTELINILATQAWQAGGGELPASLEPEPAALDSFLMPLVATGDDDTGTSVRLLSGPVRTGLTYRDNLTAAFMRHRLLVPVDAGSQRVRFVHQALLDHWRAAKRWYEERSEYLLREAHFRDEAKVWDNRGRPAALVPDADESLRTAAHILGFYNEVWTAAGRRQVAERDSNLHDYALAILGRAKNPLERYGDEGHSRNFVHLAATYDLTDLLELFIRVDPSCVGVVSERDGRTPLHHASWAELKTVRLLLDHGADPLLPDIHGWHPICAPIYTGNREVFDLLFDRYRDPNAVIGPGSVRMLHMAASNGDFDLVKWLVGAGADPATQGYNGWTPLHYAAMNGQVDTFRWLLEHSELDVADADGATPLHLAAMAGYESIFTAAFLSEGLSHSGLRAALDSYDLNGLSVLGVACSNKRAGMVARLLEHCDPRVPMRFINAGHSALHMCVLPVGRVDREEQLRARDTVAILLADERVDPNAKDEFGRTPYRRGSAFPDAREILRAHPDFEWDPNDIEPPEIRAELTDGNPRIVRSLVENLPGVLDRDLDDGATGLVILCREGRVDLVRDFIASGMAHPGANTGSAKAVAELAIKEDDAALLGLLLRFLPVHESDGTGDPDGNIRATLPWIAAQIFVSEGWTEVLDDLLKRGLHPNELDKDRAKTLLHIVATRNDIERFRWLLDRYPSEIRRDGWGRRPSDLAPSLNRTEFRKFELATEVGERSQ